MTVRRPGVNAATLVERTRPGVRPRAPVARCRPHGAGSGRNPSPRRSAPADSARCWDGRTGSWPWTRARLHRRGRSLPSRTAPCRPATSDDRSGRSGPGELLGHRPERAPPAARRALIDRIYRPLSTAGRALFETATTYLDGGGGLESTARVLFVHPNTVRYRLGRISVVTGYDLSQPREAYTVRLALAVGRLAESPQRGWRRSLQGSEAVMHETLGGQPFVGTL